MLGLTDGSATQLTSLPVDATLPAWSPDGSTIAFATPSALATVPAVGRDSHAALDSRRHRRAAVLRGRPTERILRSSTTAARCGRQRPTAAARGRSRTRSRRPTSGAARPAWSPDGADDRVHVRSADLCVTDLAGIVAADHPEPADRSHRRRLASGLAARGERHRRDLRGPARRERHGPAATGRRRAGRILDANVSPSSDTLVARAEGDRRSSTTSRGRSPSRRPCPALHATVDPGGFPASPRSPGSTTSPSPAIRTA